MLLDPTLTLAFLAFAGLLIVSPGPDTLFVVANGLRHGPRGAVAAAIGTATGSFGHATAAAFGISAIIAATPWAFDVICWGGAAYLAILGLKALLSARRASPANDLTNTGKAGASLWAVYRQGVITSVLNPKMSAFYLAVLPQFANPELGSIGLQMFLLGSIHNILGTIYLAAIGSGAGRIAVQMNARTFGRWLDGLAGAFFIALALRLALQDRPSR